MMSISGFVHAATSPVAYRSSISVQDGHAGAFVAGADYGLGSNCALTIEGERGTSVQFVAES